MAYFNGKQLPFVLQNGNSGYITPEQFGAKGNGTDDDTTYFQQAVNNANGKAVLCNGTYMITSAITLPDYTTLTTVGSGEIQSYVEDYLFISQNPLGVHGANISNIRFTNKNTTTDSNGAKKGTIFTTAHTVRMSNLSTSSYYKIADYISNGSTFQNCRFSNLTFAFSGSITDSRIIGNSISAYGRSIGWSILCNGTVNNSVFSNNFCDFWHSCFRMKSGNASAIIVGNVFDDCRCVFRDFVQQATITGNTFSNIRYDSTHWNAGVVPASLQSAVWSIFLFDGESTDSQGGTSRALVETTFSNNIARNIDHYVYSHNTNGEQKGVMVCRDVNFSQNIVRGQNGKSYKDIADFWVLNDSKTSLDRGGMVTVFFDFLDGVKVDSLTTDSDLGDMTKLVSSSVKRCIYDGMRVEYNGKIYVNHADLDSNTGACNWVCTEYNP